MQTTRLLNDRGIPAKLHVVGVDLSNQITDSFIQFYGFLNKDNNVDQKQLKTLFATCDVMLVPSKAEGYGIVFVEAAAYGMPCLAYAITGTMTSVKSGRSGVLLDLAEDEQAFAAQIEFWFEHPDIYRKLSEEARKYFENEVNWAKTVKRLIVEITDSTEKK